MTERRKVCPMKISVENLPKLASLYEKCILWAPHMVNFIHTAIKWKKSAKYSDCMNFWSPGNDWETDGTIVAVAEHHCLDVFVFTLNEDTTCIYKFLMNTDLIDYSKRVIFYGVHEKHLSAVLKYLEDKKINISHNIPCYGYTIAPKEANNFMSECPPEVYVKKLERSAAKQVNDAWPHRFVGSQEYLAQFIEVNGGWGVFLKSTDEMVAWVLRHAFGQLGMLQTEEKHKRKGYGTLVAKVLSKEIANEGHWPLGTIVVNNKASITMFEKMGFQRIGIYSFVIIGHGNEQ